MSDSRNPDTKPIPPKNSVVNAGRVATLAETLWMMVTVLSLPRGHTGAKISFVARILNGAN